MSYQRQTIPWNLLAENLEWITPGSHPCAKRVTHFHLRFLHDQRKSLIDFATAFARTVQQCADSQRLNFPENYDAPGRQDVVLSDDVAIKIEPTIRRWREMFPGTMNQERLCTHRDRSSDSPICGCPLPYEERRTEAFLRRHQENDCVKFNEVNEKAFFNLEVVKALILHGELDTVLRVCAHPDIELETWWQQRSCFDACYGDDVGWNQLYLRALDSYILFNLLACFPDTWAFDSEPSSPTMDYRRSVFYQARVYSTTTCVTDTEVVHFPHRRFFGIGDDQFRDSGCLREPERWPEHTQSYKHEIPYGEMSYEEFLSCQTLAKYQPSVAGVEEVREMLQGQGLPPEIAEMILCRAQYLPAQLAVPHHPLHPGNSAELKRYIAECWDIVIRCELMARALGMTLDWAHIVKWKIVEFFACDCWKSQFSGTYNIYLTDSDEEGDS